MTVTFVLETMATANATLFLHKKEDFVYSVSCLSENQIHVCNFCQYL